MYNSIWRGVPAAIVVLLAAEVMVMSVSRAAAGERPGAAGKAATVCLVTDGSPDTAAELWQREFERRFGKSAGPLVERGLHVASRVLPRINACVFPYGSFPTTRGWAEMQRRGDLPQYAAVEASDTEQFLNMREAARLRVEGKTSAKVWPEQSVRWFAATAAEIPAAEIDPKWDFMYFIEAMDAAGNGCIWPDLLERTPYVVIRLDRRPAAAAQP
jgi:hypothetical protein